AHQQNLDRFSREGRRLESAFGLAAGPEGHALIQHHLATLTDFVRRARAFGRPSRENTHHPALLKAIERAASYKSKLRARLTLEQKLLKAKGVKFRWSKTDWLYVGNWGFDCCQQALPAVFITREEDSDTVPAIADEAWGTAVLMATQQMLRHPIHTPT